MRFSTIACIAAFSTAALAQNNGANKGNNGGNNGGNNNNNGGNQGGNNGATGTTLQANAIQSGSAQDGTSGAGSEAGVATSKTSTNNFINNCSGKTLTNGLQVEGGSCNGIPMGDIPAKANMISSVITFPETGGDVEAQKTFDIAVQVDNLVAGSFTNAQSTYYSAPQALQGGKVVGHTHITVQDMGNSLNPTQPLDATKFTFFKGINDAGNGNGLLKATVTGGLPAGNYRVCTMTSASNHQPVLMPVAQRGTPDDCTKFTVGAGNAGGNAGNNNNNNAGNNNAGNNNAGNNNAGKNNGGNNDGGKNSAATSTAAADDAATSTTAASKATASTGGRGRQGGGNRSGGGNQNRNRGRSQRARRDFIA